VRTIATVLAPIMIVAFWVTYVAATRLDEQARRHAARQQEIREHG
jgi:hypothetical protein